MEGGVEDQPDTLPVTILFRGKQIPIHFPANSTVMALAAHLEELLGVDISTQKLVHKGKNLLVGYLDNSLAELGFQQGEKIMLVGSTAKEIEAVRSARPDALVIGFDEEIRRERRRRGVTDAKDSPYIGGYEVLHEFDNKKPSSAEALALLKKLATDPGIMAIMEKHHWTVGVLKEMWPEGKVGISEVCVLGLNTNKGESISLRLRTDDLKGFRHYNTIKETMLHELTHNQFSEHDSNFWSLFRQLKKESEELDWSKKGKTLADGPVMTATTLDIEEEEKKPQKLGGESGMDIDVRAKRIQALEKHFTEESKQNEQQKREKEVNKLEKELHKVPKKPKPNGQETPKAAQQTTQQPPPAIKRDVPSRTWNCSACTYENTADKIQCEICNTPRFSGVPKENVSEIIGEDQGLKTIQDSVSPLETKLETLLNLLVQNSNPSDAKSSLETLDTIFKNILEHPDLPKYREIKRSSNTYKNRVERVPGAKDILLSAGFVEDHQKDTVIFKRNDLGLLWLVRSLVQSRLNQL